MSSPRPVLFYKKIIPIMFAVMVISAAASAQPNLLKIEYDIQHTVSADNNKLVLGSSFGEDVSIAAASVGNLITAPLHWESSDFLTAGGVILIAAGSSFFDEDMQEAMLRNREDSYNTLRTIGSTFGGPAFAAPGVLAVYATGWITGNDKIRETGLMLSETLIAIGIAQVPARIIFGRARPLTGESHDSFQFFNGFTPERSSFISGHSATAFAISTILSHQIDNVWATIGLYSLAVLTPLSRLYDNKHWLSDTVMGSAMGYFFAKTIIGFHTADSTKSSEISLIPGYNRLVFQLRF